MSITVMFYFPDNVQDNEANLDFFVRRLEQYYKTTELPNWSIRHQLFQSTKAPRHSIACDPFATRWMALMNFSDYSERTYISIWSPSASQHEDKDLCTITISPDQTDEFVQLLGEKYSTLWSPRPRAAYIPNGRAFQANGFSVKIADVKDNAEQQRHRGVIVSVSAPTVLRPEDSVLSDEELLQSKIEARTHGLLSIALVWQVFGIRGATRKFAKKAAEVPERCDFEEAELWRGALRYIGS